MNTINTTPVTDTARLPFKKATLDFVMNAPKGILLALAKSFVTIAHQSYPIGFTSNDSYDGSEAPPFLLYGLFTSISGSNYTFDYGAIYFRGSIYLVDPITVAITSGQVCVFKITKTQDSTADPVTLSDSSVVNIHDIYKVVPSSGVSGSGDFDYADIQIY